MKKLIALVILLFVVSGCSNKSSLNSNELASALNVHWWIVKVKDHPADKYFGIRFVTPNGTKSGGGVEGRGIETNYVKVFVYGLDEKTIKYAIIGPHLSTTGSQDNPLYDYDGATMSVDNGAVVNAGDVVYKKSKAKSISVENYPIKENEIGIAFGY